MRIVALALVLALAPLSASAEILSYWVQLAPGGAPDVRAVVSDAACPSLRIGDTHVALQTRAEPDGKFPRVCSLVLPKGTKAANLISPSAQEIPLPMPVAAPNRILVLGDTGCRVTGWTVQACNDPEHWPFARIAQHGAALKPDLVLHVGDYLYRETPCPRSKADLCGGSPSGDNWATWAADFFTPAAPMLRTTPIVPVRGNHEDCNRAGPGWLRLMGPAAPKASCDGHIPPYMVPLGAMNLVVMDNADAPDRLVDRAAADVYRVEFRSLATLSPAPIWLALHRPIAGAVRLFGLSLGGNRTLIASLDDQRVLAPVSLMLSGHIHTFEAINYTEGQPPQLIAGNGGDKLNSAFSNLAGVNLGGWRVKDGISLPGFGFLLMTRRDTDWRVDAHDVDGTITRVCSFAGGRLECPK